MNQSVQSLFNFGPRGMGANRMRGSGMMAGRGRGMGGGMGGSYGGMGGGGGGYMGQGQGTGSMMIGTNTNDTDPEAINCRVFVGNLNTFKITREDMENIFRRYGFISAISMHKGYAFVQYGNRIDARAAVQGEDQRVYADQKLDCNIVSEPKMRPRKRRTGGDTGAENNMKRPRSDGGPQSNGTPYGSGDLLICGNCKQLFTNIEALANHKTQTCELKTACRCSETGNIPQSLTCATCNAEYTSAWDLCQHCQTDHGIIIFLDYQE